jgi:hypothetical protein
MEITTIACPHGFTDPNVDPGTSPIWTDGTTDYQVASGLLDGYETSDPVKAAPDRVNVVVGMSGLDALAAMGLTLKSTDEE